MSRSILRERWRFIIRPIYSDVLCIFSYFIWFTIFSFDYWWRNFSGILMLIKPLWRNIHMFVFEIASAEQDIFALSFPFSFSFYLIVCNSKVACVFLFNRSFLCGGSTGLFIYAYCLYYYYARSDMSGFMQTSFFFGYMACICYGFFLMLGTVGFRAALLFVRHIYRSIKCE